MPFLDACDEFTRAAAPPPHRPSWPPVQDVAREQSHADQHHQHSEECRRVARLNALQKGRHQARQDEGSYQPDRGSSQCQNDPVPDDQPQDVEARGAMRIPISRVRSTTE